MNRSDPDAERLLAYVDGELAAHDAAQVEARLAHDAEAAEFVAHARALRAQLQAAFAPVLDEPVPGRLQALLAQPAPAAPVVDLAAERARRAPAPPAERPAPARFAWTTWAALAASVVVGIAIGRAWPLRAPAASGSADWSASADGTLLARGALAGALEHETAARSQHPGSPVRLGASFVATDGRYCRSFELAQPALAGLACRDDAQWQLQALAAAPQAQAGGSAGRYRQAGSALPPAVLAAIDARLGSGTPLDAAGEAAALQRGWQRPGAPRAANPGH